MYLTIILCLLIKFKLQRPNNMTVNMFVSPRELKRKDGGRRLYCIFFDSISHTEPILSEVEKSEGCTIGNTSDDKASVGEQ